MLESTRIWNGEARSPEQALNIGIGIHAGPVALGRISRTCDNRMSVFGDTVNIASRLQEMTRAYSTDMIVSDELVKMASVHAPSEVYSGRFQPAVTTRIRNRAGLLPIRIAA